MKHDGINITRNKTKGQYLQNFIHDRLKKYRKDMTVYTSNVFDQEVSDDGTFQGDIDHIITYRGLIRVVEDKNWKSKVAITPGTFEYHLLSRFHKFERESGLNKESYMRVAVLSGPTIKDDTMKLLKDEKIFTIITPPLIVGDDNEKIGDFIEESILMIIGYKKTDKKMIYSYYEKV